jgi:DinB superfamily
MDDIDDLVRQFRETQDRAARLVEPLNHAQFNWRPGTQAWSIAECLDHLNVTARAVAAKMAPAIAEGRLRGLTGTGPFTYGWFSRWFEAEMEPPPRRRTRTPTVFEITANSNHPQADVLAAFRATGDAWLALLESARGLDLRRVKTTSPVTRFLRFPLGGYFRVSTAHERRHLWQAEQVRAAPGFAAA